MARRRYISTTTSTDKVVNKLATKHGDFATLLYLLMIPHAEDDGTLTGDPEELLAVVLPMRRDKTEEDVAEALAAMSALGLVEWDKERSLILFPAESFYRYQTYIKPVNRRGFTEQGNAEPMQPAQDSDQRRKTPQNAASHSPSLPHSHSHSDTPLPPDDGEAFVAVATDTFGESDLAGEEIEDEASPIPRNPKTTKRQDEEYAAKLLFAAYREVRHPTAPPMPPNGEWSKHRSDAKKLYADGATTEQVREATRAMMSRYPEANMWTFTALVRKWTALLEPAIPSRASPSQSQNGFISHNQNRPTAAVNGANTPWKRPT